MKEDKTYTKEELEEMRWFQVLSLEDLPEARRNETFRSYCMRTNQYPDKENTKLNYLIYKHELDLP